MCRFVESIRVENGRVHDLEYHNARLNRTRHDFFGLRTEIDLHQIIPIPPDNGSLFKCRIIYDDQIRNIEFLPYRPRMIKTLKLVRDDGIDYAYKYENRSGIDGLMNLRDSQDDILIVRHSRITDTSFSNIVFRKGCRYLTPADPLLKGTKRQKLLDGGIIEEADIKRSDLSYFDGACLINAMLEISTGLWIRIDDIRE